MKRKPAAEASGSSQLSGSLPEAPAGAAAGAKVTMTSRKRAVSSGSGFCEEEFAGLQEADVGGERFDLGQVVRGNKDGASGPIAGFAVFADALNQGFDQLITDHRVESGEGLIHQNQRGAKCKHAGESRLHAHAAGKMLELAIRRKVEIGEEMLIIPGGIERAKVKSM